MTDDDESYVGALDILVLSQQRQNNQEQDAAALLEQARHFADDSRLALALLAPEAIKVIAHRLQGAPAEGGQGALKAGEFPLDERGRPVTKEREETAWEVLARIGVPRLRATAIAASLAAQTHNPAPLSPGWAPDPDAEDDEKEERELDPASVDAQIAAFLEGARAAKDLGGL